MPRASTNSAATNAQSSSSPLGPFPKTSSTSSSASNSTSAATTTPLPLLPTSTAALSSSSFAAPSTSPASTSSSASSSSSSPLAPTLPPLLPPLPQTDADAAEKALAELQEEEKAEGTGRMWDKAETERLHREFQTYWDANKKAPTSQYEWAKVHLAEEKEARKQKEPKGDKPMATRMWTQKDTERLHTMFKQEWDKTGKGPKSKWHAYTALLFKRSKRAIQGKWYEWAKVAGIGLRAWPKMEADGKLSGGAMLSDSSDDSEGEYPTLPTDEDGTGAPAASAATAAAVGGEETKEGEQQSDESKEGTTAMTDVAPTLTTTKKEGDKQSDRQARKRRREERRSAGSNTAASTSTLDTLRLSPADFQHILELRVGGINFGTLLVSSGDQPAAVQLVYKEGQTVTWNNPAFPLPSPPVSSSSTAAASTAAAAGAGASPSASPAAAELTGKAESG